MNYPDLEFWQKSRRLSTEIYRTVQTFPQEERGGLCQQLRETAAQIPTDIAIGASSKYHEFAIRQLQMAKAGLFKLETLILIAEDLEYIDEDKLDAILQDITTCQKLMDGYARSMNKPKVNS